MTAKHLILILTSVDAIRISRSIHEMRVRPEAWFLKVSLPSCYYRQGPKHPTLTGRPKWWVIGLSLLFRN